MKALLEEAARATVGVTAPVVAPLAATHITEPYLGAAVNVVIAVCAGAIAAFAFVEGKEDRRRLFQVAAGTVVIGSALTTLLAELLKWKFKVELSPTVVSAMGVMVGALLRFVLPPIIQRIPGWLDAVRIPFLSKSK
jgi:hypothetical protein